MRCEAILGVRASWLCNCTKSVCVAETKCELLQGHTETNTPASLEPAQDSCLQDGTAVQQRSSSVKQGPHVLYALTSEIQQNAWLQPVPCSQLVVCPGTIMMLRSTQIVNLV